MQDGIAANIEREGWHAQFVGGDDTWPPFIYSIGFGLERAWPEVLILGVGPELGHGMLRSIWESGVAPAPEQMRDDIIRQYQCKFLPVHISWFEFHFGQAIGYYMDRNLPCFRAVQCVLPDKERRFPWDEGVSEGFRALQPLVNEVMEKEPGK